MFLLMFTPCPYCSIPFFFLINIVGGVMQGMVYHFLTQDMSKIKLLAIYIGLQLLVRKYLYIKQCPLMQAIEN